MRRIVAIGLIIVVVFLLALVIDLALKTYIIVNFITMVVGPGAVNAIYGIYNWIIATIGFAGFSGIVLVFGLVCGVLIYKYWHKTDWWLRRWGQARTAKDLGTTTVTGIPTTPLGATTRPVATLPLQPTEGSKTVTEEPAKEAEQ